VGLLYPIGFGEGMAHELGRNCLPIQENSSLLEVRALLLTPADSCQKIVVPSKQGLQGKEVCIKFRIDGENADLDSLSFYAYVVCEYFV